MRRRDGGGGFLIVDVRWRLQPRLIVEKVPGLFCCYAVCLGPRIVLVGPLKDLNTHVYSDSFTANPPVDIAYAC